MKSPGGEGNVSPEHQMNKLREQSRTGGTGSGGGGRAYSGGTDVSVTPTAETFISLTQKEEPEKHAGTVELDLSPDANDKDMEDLLGILQKQGFSAVMKELDRINNPHIEDDFHRLLIQYKQDGHPVRGIKKDNPIAKTLNFVLFEVAIPVAVRGMGEQTLKDIFAQMEQLHRALLPHVPDPYPVFMKGPRRRALMLQEHFTFELAVSCESEDAVFYIALDRKKRDHFEKQILSVFPRARITEKKNDYNVFNQFGISAGSRGKYLRGQALPIRTGASFDYDPMNVTLSALSKIAKDGEGAAIQMCIGPTGDHLKNQITQAYKEVEKGANVFSAQIKHFLFADDPLTRRMGPLLGKFFKDLIFGVTTEDSDKSADSSLWAQAISEKLKTQITGVNLRLVASARTKERAESILSDLESTFQQFEHPFGNRISFKRVKGKKKLREFFREFIWRILDRGYKEHPFPITLFSTYKLFSSFLMYMSVAEIAVVLHLSIGGGTSSREVKTSKSVQAPSPPGLSKKGILLGRNNYANTYTDIYFSPEDRLRHFYTIGQTGTGKTTFLKNMIVQDIENGEGVAFIDPHGVDVQDVLSRIPKERYDDVIYFDPANTSRPMGLNMLEFDPRFPEQKTFVVDEMFKIFKKLYGDVPEAFGPIFETYFRNATLLVLEDPETGSTLMDISRVLADEDFRRLKLSRSKNPVVNHFWEDVAEQVRGEGDLRNVVPYITSKFDIFIANEIMRPIVGQQRSAFNFQEVMENKKILLVNLSKGRLGDINADLIGLVIVGKILMGALSRSETLGRENHPPFFLYMDEFQNISTTTIATILSEARKYGLSLTIAHQFIKQLNPVISNAVFGNVGSMAVFRVGPDDAQFLEKQYSPVFTVSDMLNVDNFNAFIKLLSEGKPVDPFSLETNSFQSGDFAQIDALKQMSSQRYGRPREAVEEEIREKYKGMRGMK